MALNLGKDPTESLQLLDKAGWIETDLRTPMRKVREIDGIRGIMLNKQASRCWLALTDEVDVQPLQAKPNSISKTQTPKVSYESPTAPKEKTKPKANANSGISGETNNPHTLAMGKPTSKPMSLDNPLSTKDIDRAIPTIPAKPKPSVKLEVSSDKPNTGQSKPASKAEAASPIKLTPSSPEDRESETGLGGQPDQANPGRREFAFPNH